MSTTYEINTVRKTVTVMGSGNITVEEILSLLEKLKDDLDYKAPMKMLIDWRNIKSIKISSSEIEKIARRKIELVARFSGERCAFVASANSAFETATSLQNLINGAGLSAQVFRNIKDAMDWLYYRQHLISNGR